VPPATQRAAAVATRSTCGDGGPCIHDEYSSELPWRLGRCDKRSIGSGCTSCAQRPGWAEGAGVEGVGGALIVAEITKISVTTRTEQRSAPSSEEKTPAPLESARVIRT